MVQPGSEPTSCEPPQPDMRQARTLESLFDFNHPMPVDQSREQEIVADKTLRQQLDVWLQNIKSCPPSRERSLAITKLQESIMWLGMDLKRLNESNPYPESYNPANTKIEPTADGLKL